MSDTPIPTVPPEVLQTFSDALTQSLVAQTAASGQPMVEAESTGNGFALAVTYSGVVYALTVSMPGAEGEPYVFSVTMKKGQAVAVALVTFNYISAKDWSLVAGTPEIVAGPVTIKTLSIDICATKDPKSLDDIPVT